jgi:hypothetical protein
MGRSVDADLATTPTKRPKHHVVAALVIKQPSKAMIQLGASVAGRLAIVESGKVNVLMFCSTRYE